MAAKQEIKEIEFVNFGVFSADEILKISVAKLTNPKQSGSGPGTVYDERMGLESTDPKLLCKTCSLPGNICPGHFGHIELKEPIIHPRFFKHVLSWLRCFCISCKEPLIDKNQIQLCGLMKYKRNFRFDKIIEKLKKVDTCFACNSTQPKITHCVREGTIKTTYKHNSDNVDIPLTVHDIMKIFEAITDEHVEMMGFNPKLTHPLNLIIINLLVLPPCARPVVITETSISDDDLTNKYSEIIKANEKLGNPKDNMEESTRQSNIQALKFHIATLFDNSQGKAKHSINGKPVKGIKERISGKEGQIRNNLMGKRCNETGRTVIGPGPTLRLDQVGVPMEIASNLTIPETVTPFNKDYLWNLIETGKANYVQKKGKDKKGRISVQNAMYTQSTDIIYGDVIMRNGKEYLYTGQHSLILKEGDTIRRNGIIITDIELPKKKDFSINIGDVVIRQLLNGDDILVNRQPTLHKGSMMAMKVVVMPCKTLRFNLAITKSFNADFDGDEMNIHVPQSQESRVELNHLSSTKHNLMTAQSSKPNIVIVQDSLLASYLMTQPGVTMTREQFFDVSNRAINLDGTPLSPKFILTRMQQIRKVLKLKGKKLQAFTGKGLFSLILPENFNYENKNDINTEEPIVKIYKGVMYEGVFNKSDLGNFLLQLLYKEYGNEVLSTFIDNVQFMTNHWLVHRGFSVGIKDCVASKTDEISSVVEKCFMEARGIEETTYHDGIKEIRVNAALSKARDVGLRIAKNALNNDNNFLSTVNAGSKGDFFNVAQITGLVGQQNLRGQRIPKHLNRGKRTLPHYPFGEISKEMEYESRGFIRHSFIQGLNPQEFYFHAMSGREGITDTAMGTSKSGYIQRRIIKVMEDISVKYDGTVRNTEGNIFQFSYGDDGFDPSETIFRKGVSQACDVSRLVDQLNMEYEK